MAVRTLAFAAMALALSAHGVVGQDQSQAQAPDASKRFAFMPVIGLTWHGVRYEATRDQPGVPGAPDKTTLGPTNGPLFGAGLEVRVSPLVSLGGSFSFSSVNYRWQGTSDGEPVDTRVSGTQRLFRALGGVLVRVQETAPGYFTVGGGAVVIDPSENPFAETGGRRTDPAGYAGVGLDFASGGHRVRVEGRVVGSKPSVDALAGQVGSGLEFEAKGTAWDFFLTLAYLFEF